MRRLLSVMIGVFLLVLGSQGCGTNDFAKPIATAAAASAAVETDSHTPPTIPAPSTDISVDSLPAPTISAYRCDPYIECAAKFQALGKERALPVLRQLAKSTGRRDHRVILLCRMLFSNRPDKPLSRPALGAGGFPRGDSSSWPDEPLAIVDGVPFLIVFGYSLGGVPEHPSWYLDRCEKDADWSTYRYRPRSMKDKEASLAKFLALPAWMPPADKRERATYERQIGPPAEPEKEYSPQDWQPAIAGLELTIQVKRKDQRSVWITAKLLYQAGQVVPPIKVKVLDQSAPGKVLTEFEAAGNRGPRPGRGGSEASRGIPLEEGREVQFEVEVEGKKYTSPIMKS
jgi:hypothetical protein